MVITVEPSPGHQEDGSHRHSDGSAVQRVTGTARQQHGVNPQSRCRAEDGADIGGVADGADHTDTSGILQNIGEGRRGLPPHRTEHSSCQGIARQFRQQRPDSCIDGYVATSFDDIRSIPVDMFVLTEQGQRLIPSLQCHSDHLRTLRDEDSHLCIQPVSQLRLRQRPKHFYAWLLE